MTALVGLVLSALAASSPGANAAANACTPNDDACEASVTTPGPAEELETYATPSEVDCPATTRITTTVGRADLDLFSGACSFPIFDFRYRVSRLPDSERPTGSLRPQRGRRAGTPVATTSGLPNDPRGVISTASIQPIAVYAVTLTLMPPISATVGYDSNRRAPTRILEPVERPPRA